MDLPKQEHYLSKSRLSKYLLSSKGEEKKAIRLYRANLALSGALYTVLSNFEISLRNAINTQLSIHFGDSDWIINQQTGYMADPKLDNSVLRYKFVHKKKINNTLKNIRKKRITPTSGMVISDQTLGFWVSYFEKKTYAAIGGHSAINPIFTNLPPNTKRSAIYDRLEKIRMLRNRIAHHEPICFAKGTNNFNLTETEKTYELIYELLGWMDSDLKKWVKKTDQVRYNLEKAQLCSANKTVVIHFSKLSIIKLKSISTR